MEPRRLNTTNKFEEEAELAKRRGKDTQKMRSVIELLIHRQSLPHELNDQPLRGEFKGYRNLHIEPSWLLIYKADDRNLWLLRTRSYAHIFGK